MKTIVSFGDEYCFGISSPAAIVADKMNLSFIDKARNDTSNFKIHRDIVKYISDNDTADCLFIIGWTSPRKFDIYWKESYFTLNEKEQKYFPSLYNKLTAYFDYLLDDYLVHNSWANDIFSVQQMCKHLGIKYYMFNTQKKLLVNQYNQSTVKAIDFKYYLDPLNTNCILTNYLEQKGHNTKYYSNESKRCFGEYLHDRIANCLN